MCARPRPPLSHARQAVAIAAPRWFRPAMLDCAARAAVHGRRRTGAPIWVHGESVVTDLALTANLQRAHPRSPDAIPPSRRRRRQCVACVRPGVQGQGPPRRGVGWRALSRRSQGGASQVRRHCRPLVDEPDRGHLPALPQPQGSSPWRELRRGAGPASPCARASSAATLG